ERLHQFSRHPDEFGPMLVNTTIDSAGYTTAPEMLESPWNLALIRKWALLCEEIANTCPDRNRFGSHMQLRDWQKQITDRLYRISLAIIKEQLSKNEQTRARLLQVHMRQKEMK
ncbi:hypothetical protein BDP27DRAFT_1181021, partial [Rhodocollybia butyracea]